jgi:hypothetical protein
VCTVDAGNPATFVRQEVWTGGAVQWPDGRRTESGRLLNVGGKRQPLNDQVFIQYSGIWGSPGGLFSFSGYWGPAFNETGAREQYTGLPDVTFEASWSSAPDRVYYRGSLFITAWCDGLEVQPRSHDSWFRECHPAAQTR